MVEASRAGRLSERGESWTSSKETTANFVEGVNAMLDAILLPIGEGNRESWRKSAQGNIDELITADLQWRPRRR